MELAIPEDQLDAVGALGSEHVDRAEHRPVNMHLVMPGSPSGPEALREFGDKRSRPMTLI